MKNKSVLHFVSGLLILFFGFLAIASGTTEKATTSATSKKLFYECKYILNLIEVERPADAQKRYGNSKIDSFEEEGKRKISFEDNMINIIWLPTDEEFSFILKNKTNNSIKIVWDEAVFVDENGSNSKVMHSGVKYIDKNNSQPPTIVMKNSSVNDIIVPTEHIYYSSGRYGGWRTLSLISNTASSKEKLDELIASKVGKTVHILLPLQIEETINEYIFTFKIDSFVYKD